VGRYSAIALALTLTWQLVAQDEEILPPPSVKPTPLRDLGFFVTPMQDPPPGPGPGGTGGTAPAAGVQSPPPSSTPSTSTVPAAPAPTPPAPGDQTLTIKTENLHEPNSKG
jgi:hypothetical protein